MKKYILTEQKIIIELVTFERWMDWMKIESNRRVAKELIDGDRIEVSTVFVGYNLLIGSPKLYLFETRVFGGKLNGESIKSQIWDEALIAHTRMVEQVKYELLNSTISKKQE